MFFKNSNFIFSLSFTFSLFYLLSFLIIITQSSEDSYYIIHSSRENDSNCAKNLHCLASKNSTLNYGHCFHCFYRTYQIDIQHEIRRLSSPLHHYHRHHQPNIGNKSDQPRIKERLEVALLLGTSFQIKSESSNVIFYKSGETGVTSGPAANGSIRNGKAEQHQPCEIAGRNSNGNVVELHYFLMFAKKVSQATYILKNKSPVMLLQVSPGLGVTEPLTYIWSTGKEMLIDYMQKAPKNAFEYQFAYLNWTARVNEQQLLQNNLLEMITIKRDPAAVNDSANKKFDKYLIKVTGLHLPETAKKHHLDWAKTQVAPNLALYVTCYSSERPEAHLSDIESLARNVQNLLKSKHPDDQNAASNAYTEFIHRVIHSTKLAILDKQQNQKILRKFNDKSPALIKGQLSFKCAAGASQSWLSNIETYFLTTFSAGVFVLPHTNGNNVGDFLFSE